MKNQVNGQITENVKKQQNNAQWKKGISDEERTKAELVGLTPKQWRYLKSHTVSDVIKKTVDRTRNYSAEINKDGSPMNIIKKGIALEMLMGSEDYDTIDGFYCGCIIDSRKTKMCIQDEGCALEQAGVIVQTFASHYEIEKYLERKHAFEMIQRFKRNEPVNEKIKHIYMSIYDYAEVAGLGVDDIWRLCFWNALEWGHVKEGDDCAYRIDKARKFLVFAGLLSCDSIKQAFESANESIKKQLLGEYNENINTIQ